MRTIVFVISASMIILSTLLTVMSVCQISLRRHELDRVLAREMVSVMDACYQKTDAIAAGEMLEKGLKEALGQEVGVTIFLIDMVDGLMSVCVEDILHLPVGADKHISSQRVLMVDREKLWYE